MVRREILRPGGISSHETPLVLLLMKIEICTDADTPPSDELSEVLADPGTPVLEWLVAAISQIANQENAGGSDFIVLCFTCDSGSRLALELKTMPKDEADLFFQTP